MDESLLNVDKWAVPLMLIPGPKEPKAMDIHWKVIGDEFHLHAEEGMTLRYREKGETSQFQHKPFLVRVCCDACARHKLLKDRTATAVHPCPWCKVESDRNARSKIFGYAKETPCSLYDWDTLLTCSHTDLQRIAMKEVVGMQIGVTNPSMYKITLEEHLKRSEILEAMEHLHMSKVHKNKVKQIVGLSGKCDISWRLKTLHPLHFVYLPVYHTLVLGIVKDFLRHMFRPDLKESQHHEAMKPRVDNFKKIGTSRKRIIMSCDLDEPCIDLETCDRLLVSNTVAFLETYSCFLFNANICGFRLLSEKGLEAWSYLRKAVLYFLRDSEDMEDKDKWAQLRDEAKSNLLRYACICEEYMPSLCVQNLHIALCRLFDQEEFCGRPNICHDMFMERAVRQLKTISYRDNHEKSFVYRNLLQEGRAWLQSEFQSHDCDDGDVEQGNGYDKPAEEFTHAVGKGKLILEDEFGREEALAREATDGYDSEDLDLQVYKHPSLILQRGQRLEVIKSESGNLESAKKSNIIIVRIDSEERLAVVKFFFRVATNAGTLWRGAVVNILPREVMLEDEVNTMALVGKVYKFKAKVTNDNLSPSSEWSFERRNVLINISQIMSKVSLFMGGAVGDLNWIYCGFSKSRSNQLTQQQHSLWMKWKIERQGI